MQSAPYFKVKCNINLLRDYEYEGDDAADNKCSQHVIYGFYKFGKVVINCMENV